MGALILDDMPGEEKKQGYRKSSTTINDVKEDLISYEPAAPNQQISDDLITEIENYLQDVIQNGEKCIDISETEIGDYGAKAVAAVIPLTESVEDIRLVNCDIGDEGAIELFEELEGNGQVVTVELSSNPITEKSFPALLKMLEKNKNIKRVELMNLKVKSKLSLNKLKTVADRVIFQ